jgi:hypothetical protein
VPGQRTVSVELRQGGQTASSSDSIFLEFTVPMLGNPPSELKFTYSIGEQCLYPAFVQLTPLNVNVAYPTSLTWQLTTAGSWVFVSPSQGTTPASFRITPSGFDTGSPSSQSGSVTVTVIDPANVFNSPRTIQLTLRVVNARMRNEYLALTTRNWMR